MVYEKNWFWLNHDKYCRESVNNIIYPKIIGKRNFKAYLRESEAKDMEKERKRIKYRANIMILVSTHSDW